MINSSRQSVFVALAHQPVSYHHKLSELSSSSSIASEGLPLPFDQDVLIHINSNIATKRTQLSSLLVAF